MRCKASTIMPAGNTSLQVTLAPLSISSLQLAGNLPVLALDIVTLTAVKTGDQVRLDFNVGNNNEAILFEIERSADGVAFNSIGTIAATATVPPDAGQGKNYSFYDKRPLPSGQSGCNRQALLSPRQLISVILPEAYIF